MANQVTIIKQPLYGTVVWNGSQFIYTPNIGFVGRDYYVYTTTDGNNAETITVYTDTVNQPIVASDINLTTNAADTLTINLNIYVTDDGRVYPYKITNITQPSKGSTTNTDNIIYYKSNGYDGIEQFYYTVSDGQYDATGKITITVINGSNVEVPQYIREELDSIESILGSVQSLSSDWNNTYNILCSSSANWNNLDPLRYNYASTIVENNSSNWNDMLTAKVVYDQAYTVVKSKSADWNYVSNNIVTVTNLLTSNSAYWTTSYTVLCGNSSKWIETTNNLSNLVNTFTTYSGNWNNSYNLVNSDSAGWDKRFYLNILSSTSGNWNESYTILTANSSKWNSNTNKINTLTSIYTRNSSNWLDAYNTVYALSDGWGDLFAITLLTTNSAKWNAVADSKESYDNAYTLLCSGSADWNYVKNNFNFVFDKFSELSGGWNNSYTIVSGGSAKWNASYTTLQNISTDFSTNSSNWNNVYTLVSTTSTKWDNTVLNNILTGNSGNWNTSYTLATANSSNWDNSYNILTSVSSNYFSNSGNWNNAYNIVCASSAIWSDTTIYTVFSSNSSSWNDLVKSKTNYDNSYTLLCGNSSDWNYVKDKFFPVLNTISASSANWNNSFNLVSGNSGKWTTAYNLATSFTTNSSNWNNSYTLISTTSTKWDNTIINTILTGNSGNWNNTFTNVTGSSSNWNTSYNILTSVSSDYFSNSGNWNNAYNIVCANSAIWSDTTIYTVFSSNSSSWTDILSSKPNYDNAYTLLCGNSSDWNYVRDNFAPVSTIVTNNSGAWNNTYATICSNSAAWNNISTTVSTVCSNYVNNSANWSNSYNLVCANSSYWDNTDIITIVNDGNTKWNLGYTTLCANSATWNSTTTNLNNLITDYNLSSVNWNSYYTVVTGNSSSWGDAEAVSIIVSQSANYSNTFSIVCANSSKWNSVSSVYIKYDNTYSVVTANSSNWTNTFNLVSTNSAAWNNVITTITGTSARWLFGDISTNFTANNLYISGNAVFYGSLTADGETTQLNTSIVATSAFSLYNTGNVDALAVTKSTNVGAIANFSNAGGSVLYVDPNNKVGINTSSPSEALTVVGNITATGNIYGKMPDVYTVFQSNSGRYETTSSYFNLSSVTITQLLTTSKPNYDTTYTYVTGISSSINSFLTGNKPNYDNAYATVCAQSGSVYTSYTFLSSNSGKVGTDTIYRAKSANYESAFTWVQNNSGAAAAVSQINVIFDGGGDIINSGSYVIIQIPSKVGILNWSVLADLATTNSYIDVLSCDYSNYPTFTKISPNSNTDTSYIKIAPPFQKSTSPTTLTNWITGVASDSLLKFNLISNSTATLLTVSLKCVKLV